MLVFSFLDDVPAWLHLLNFITIYDHSRHETQRNFQRCKLNRSFKPCWSLSMFQSNRAAHGHALGCATSLDVCLTNVGQRAHIRCFLKSYYWLSAFFVWVTALSRGREENEEGFRSRKINGDSLNQFRLFVESIDWLYSNVSENPDMSSFSTKLKCCYGAVFFQSFLVKAQRAKCVWARTIILSYR